MAYWWAVGVLCKLGYISLGTISVAKGIRPRCTRVTSLRRNKFMDPEIKVKIMKTESKAIEGKLREEEKFITIN